MQHKTLKTSLPPCKRQYNTPSLKMLGSVKKLTLQGKSGSGSDIVQPTTDGVYDG